MKKNWFKAMSISALLAFMITPFHAIAAEEKAVDSQEQTKAKHSVQAKSEHSHSKKSCGCRK